MKEPSIGDREQRIAYLIKKTGKDRETCIHALHETGWDSGLAVAYLYNTHQL